MTTSNRSRAGAERYLATSSTQGAFTLADGRLAADPSLSNVSHRLFSLGAYRGAELTFFGAGAENATANYRVYIVRRGVVGGADGRKLGDYELMLYCSGSLTLSTAMGNSAGPIAASERIADAVSATLSSYGTALENGFGSGGMQTVSGSNTPGKLIIPDAFDASDLLVEFDLTGAVSANCLVDLTR